MLLSNFGSRLKSAQQKAGQPLAEFAVLLLAISLFGALLVATRRVAAPFTPQIQIDLSLSALPLYTFYSLLRGLTAYLLSLGFAIAFGTIAARSARAERWMIPALDVLQAVPVLGFLPGFVLAMISIFPRTELGLELACVLMIFTGQAWNMAFSYHASLRNIPNSLREVARLSNFSRLQIFRYLEVPSAMIALVWNSMMSMAGGWFFLSINEAFTLGSKDFRLPGIGSYMSEAIHQGNRCAMLAAVVAMVIMIVAVDQLLWRPIVVWSQRFKLEDQSSGPSPTSWFYNLLTRSRLLRSAREWFSGRVSPLAFLFQSDPLRPARARRLEILWAASKMALLFVAAAGGFWAVSALLRLLLELPWDLPRQHADWLGVLLALGASFLRTSSAVFLGAIWTVPAGIMIGLSPRWSQRLQPVIQIVASFPAPMLFPVVTLLILRMGIPFNIGCVALMLLGAQWYILFNVIAGAQALPLELKEVAAVCGFSTWSKWRYVYLPAIFPALVTGLVTSAGGAWNATIVSEFVQFKNVHYSAFGLGSLISEATASGNFPLLAAGVSTMAVSVVLINRYFWRRLSLIAENKYSLSVGG